MPTSQDILLYSTNAYLAHFLAEQFYKGHHYVWCGSVFNPRSLDDLNPLKNIPSTSSPHDIYAGLRKECIDSDLHGANIERIKTGLLKGAGFKLAEGVITDSQYGHVIHIIKNAQLKFFNPLIYVIPRSLVETKLEKVAFDKMASPLSDEYIIPNLTLSEFNVIDLKNI
ncbi:MAG TPA: hypothetical protein VK154_11200 [Chitinophagales bacterium]|nr:hypothetical protein [Chitinophagales bacterium]